jgi:GntR family transcriptional regulator
VSASSALPGPACDGTCGDTVANLYMPVHARSCWSSVRPAQLRLFMIDPELSTPVYRQLAVILAEQIRSGVLAAGRPVPSEARLQQEYGVARGTARKAIAYLRERGLVHTVVGKGTYVGPAPKDA